MNKPLMIAIYSNTGEWGGVNVLIERFAKYLSSREIKFCIIEQKGTRLREDLPWVNFVEVNQLTSIAQRITHLFVPSISMLRSHPFPWASLSHAKIFAWIVHPNDAFRGFFPLSGKLFDTFGYFSVKPLRILFRSHTRLFDSFFLLLIKENALAVMDGATRRSLMYFVPSLSLAPDIVPVPSSLLSGSKSDVTNQHEDVTKLSIGYLGRMDSIKWSAIQPFILHTLAPMTKNKKIELHLVSEGSHLSKLKQLCTKINIECYDYGYLPNQKAREIIFSHTNIAIAMGTSALDIAGSGHPCVIIDPSLSVLARHQKKFRFVHEIENYTLGEFRDFPFYIEGTHVFEEMVDNNQLNNACLKGQKYVQQTHNPINCFDKLLSNIQTSSLAVGDLAIHVHFLETSFNETKHHPFLYALGGLFQQRSKST